MPSRIHSRQRAAIAVILAVLVGLCSTLRAADEPERVPPREIQRLAAQFRRAKTDADRRGKLVDEAVELGSDAAAALQLLISREMRPAVERYRQRFHERARRLSQQRLAKVDPREVASLRQQALALREQPDLTKEMIQQHGDPALARLREMFVLSREEVLEQSADLQSERDELLAPGLLWERCAIALFDATPDDARPGAAPSFEAYLAGEEEIAVGLAVPMDAATQQILAANVRLATRLDPEESRCVLALNLMRNLLGLRPLLIDLQLTEAARGHSADMERLKFFAHDSPVPGKKTPWDRAKLAGTSASGENIFAGLTDGNAANEGWWHSPGHHKNMLGDHKRVGVGRAGHYFTELLGG